MMRKVVSDKRERLQKEYDTHTELKRDIEV